MILQLKLVAGCIGLHRDSYRKQDAKPVESRGAYQQRVARTLALAGMPEKSTVAAATGVLALEARLAGASLDASTAGDPKATEHKTTFAELEKLVPRFD